MTVTTDGRIPGWTCTQCNEFVPYGVDHMCNKDDYTQTLENALEDSENHSAILTLRFQLTECQQQLDESMDNWDKLEKLSEKRGNQRDQLAEALRLARKFIDLSPGDPDVFPAQYEAWIEFLAALASLESK